MAGAPRNKDVTELDIESLLDTIVVTASKSPEAIQSAPAVMTVITDEEIRRFGATNLQDVLDRVVSMYVVGSFLFRDNVASLRGDLSTHFDNHILMLLDGRPIRASAFTVDIPIFRQFPLDAVDRIEIIRGPGSVLYGSQAFTGAINIVMKKGTESGASVARRQGSFDETQDRLSAGGSVGPARFFAAVSRGSDRGWNFSAQDEAGVRDSAAWGESGYGAVLSAAVGGLTLTGLYAEDRQTDLLNVLRFPANQASYRKGMVDLGYQLDVSESWAIQANATYNYHYQYFLQRGSAIDNAMSNDVMAELSTRFQPLSHLNVLVGGSASYLTWSDDDPAHPSVPTFGYGAETWYGLYGQADYTIAELVKLVAGLQVNKPETIAADVVPRFGAIVTLPHGFGLKLLYGQAFRSPQAVERFIDAAGVVRGDPSLRPEKVGTLEAQASYMTDRVQASLAYFNSLQRNTISRLPPPGPGQQALYANRGRLTTYGVELELKYVPSRRYMLEGSASYYQSELLTTDGRKIRDATHVPNLMLKAGASVDLAHGLTVGVFNIYASEPSDIAKVTPTVAEVNPAPGAYDWLTANLSIRIDELLGTGSPLAPTVTVYGTNLVGARVDYPEFARQRINSIPGKPPPRGLRRGLAPPLTPAGGSSRRAPPDAVAAAIPSPSARHWVALAGDRHAPAPRQD